jgi:hypothetical protein
VRFPVAIAVALAVVLPATVAADTAAAGWPRGAADSSKLAREGVAPGARAHPPGKDKRCCGYPLSADLGFALRFYWLAEQDRFADDHDEVDLYDRNGFFLGAFPSRYVRALRLEGSGLLSDGRVINYAGRCGYGVGTCFEQLDARTHPYGRGAGRRPLLPFTSVAVDRRLIAIGEPLYIPEFDGLRLPDGNVHDGCVRADDTGGGIKHRKIDFFVVTYDNFRFLLSELLGIIWITPHIEHPRCRHLGRR